jgi:site-specific recombinase XerD
MTPLRQRLLDDLRLRNYAQRTIEAYVSGVARFARHFGRSPDQLGPDEIRAYQLHLLERKVSWSQFNQIVCSLRFFFNVTLGRPELVEHLPYGKRPRTLPVVLSPDEVLRLLEAAQPGRDRVLFQTAYACGLRVSELVRLQVTDLDSARLIVTVRQGKGHKDRQVPLSPRLLGELRAYWKLRRPRPWLFPAPRGGGHLGTDWVQKLCRRLVARAGLSKRVTPHTLRHSFATHLLEAGADLLTLQKILGHRDLTTTARYVHLSTRHLRQAPSLLDLLPLPQPATAAPAAVGTPCAKGPRWKWPTSSALLATPSLVCLVGR